MEPETYVGEMLDFSKNNAEKTGYLQVKKS
jgi:hypothetical protein